MIQDGQPPQWFGNWPELDILLQGFMVLRETGQKPWELGIDVPRRRFACAVLILSPYWSLYHFAQRCPLLSSE